MLTNPRHERYAQSRASGKSIDEAYVDAGFKANRGNAARLNAKESVMKRIAQLQEPGAKKAEVTIDSLAKELEEARSMAIAEKQSSAAVAATMGKAKLFGLGSETRKLTGTIQVVTITAKQLDALTDNELASLEAAYPVLQKLGLVGGDSPAAAETGGAEES